MAESPTRGGRSFAEAKVLSKTTGELRANFRAICHSLTVTDSLFHVGYAQWRWLLKNMKTRYNRFVAGRVTPNVRNQVRPTIAGFARRTGEQFNTVFGAVIWAAEQMKGRVTLDKVTALVSTSTVRDYGQELARKRAARINQLRGIVRHSLSVDEQTEDRIARILASVQGVKGSIPVMKAAVAYAISVERTSSVQSSATPSKERYDGSEVGIALGNHAQLAPLSA